MRLANIKIWTSPMTNKIYAGFASKGIATSKFEVNDQVIQAVAQYLDQTGEEIECKAGKLKFERSKESLYAKEESQ